MSEFDERWRQLARSATGHTSASPLPTDLARRARNSPVEPIPFVSPRWVWALSASAALLTVALLPLAPYQDLPPLVSVDLRPPALPSPPTIESPGHYATLIRSSWKDFAP